MDPVKKVDLGILFLIIFLNIVRSWNFSTFSTISQEIIFGPRHSSMVRSPSLVCFGTDPDNNPDLVGEDYETRSHTELYDVLFYDI